MLSRMVTLALLLLTLVSCGSTNLYLIEKQDIYRIPKGTMIDDQVADRDGYFISDLYLEKVAEAKIKRRGGR